MTNSNKQKMCTVLYSKRGLSTLLKTPYVLGLSLLLLLASCPSADGLFLVESGTGDYLDAVTDLPQGWKSETVYQTSPLSPIAICETNAFELLILDREMHELLELQLNGTITTYLPTGNISLDSIGYQPNADRIVGIGEHAFFISNEASFEVIKEQPSNVSFTTLTVNTMDDSIYTASSENDSSIYHFDANGGYISTVRTGILGCSQVALDPALNLLYYSETYPGRITCLNLTANTTTTLTSGIAIPGTGEGISIATSPTGDLYYLVAEGTDSGFYKYNGSAFENIMNPAYGIGSISWSRKFESILATPGGGGCVVQYDPNGTKPKRLTPQVSVKPIIETSEGLLLVGLEDSIYRIDTGSFNMFISDLPYSCGSLVLDNDENIYASLNNDSVLILGINTDGTNSTWFVGTGLIDGFPRSLVYDSKNDQMILMTFVFTNNSLDLWRLPVDSPYEFSKIVTIENASIGDCTVDKDGNIYVAERSDNVLYQISDGTNDLQVLFSNFVEHAYLVTPPIGFSTLLDAVILCRNDDLQAWPVNGSGSYIFAQNKVGIDNIGLFENAMNELLCTHSGQIYRLSYEVLTTSQTTDTTTATSGTSTSSEAPIDYPPYLTILIMGGSAIIGVLVIVLVLRSKR
ncbi:MAG: hypothetical protein ACFFDR_08825 [Candidatus Thorarchaeota archaeon]